MRPLHVLDSSVPRVAGYCSRTRSILAAQRAAGMDPVAITGLRQGRSPAYSERIDGVLHLRTSSISEGSPPIPGLSEVMEMAALSRAVSEAARQHAVDIVHAHSPILCGIPAQLVARRASLPSVYEIRAFWEDAAAHQGKIDPDGARYAAIRKLESGLVRTADAVVVLCHGIRRDLIRRGVPEARLHVIPNGVDTERFRPLERDERLAREHGLSGKTVVAYIGTLFRFEGVELLLRALARLTADNDAVRGLIVGQGEALDEVKALASSLRLGDKVIITGGVSSDAVERYYSLADILCYPRHSHRITELTTPLKPLEAMSMGKAVIGSDVGGLRELVRDLSTGFIHRAGDVDHLTQLLERLVASPPLRRRLGDAARAEMIRSRSWRTIVRGYDEVYALARERSRGRARWPRWRPLEGLSPAR